MKFRVTFMERNKPSGAPAVHPERYMEANLPEGVVLDKTFLERLQAAVTHVEDRLEEDDNFLSLGSETWVYDVHDEREQEFLAAVEKSGIVMECEPLGDEIDLQ